MNIIDRLQEKAADFLSNWYEMECIGTKGNLMLMIDEDELYLVLTDYAVQAYPEEHEGDEYRKIIQDETPWIYECLHEAHLDSDVLIISFIHALFNIIEGDRLFMKLTFNAQSKQ